MDATFGLHPDFGDPEQMLNMRDWLERAVTAKGARMTGGGCGMGEADIDVELEGHLFNIRIKPILHPQAEGRSCASTIAKRASQ